MDAGLGAPVDHTRDVDDKVEEVVDGDVSVDEDVHDQGPDPERLPDEPEPAEVEVTELLYDVPLPPYRAPRSPVAWSGFSDSASSGPLP